MTGAAAHAKTMPPVAHPDADTNGADPQWSCRVNGSPLDALPLDLYIPPDALEVFLESFEGPLDLLLYLIRRQNVDVLAIPIAEITRQYMLYIEVIQALRLDLAGEYLVMAALLAEIKSRLLLPRPERADDDPEEDPRLALIRQLQEYERFKTAAERLDALPRLERDCFHAQASHEALASPPLPAPALEDLLEALVGVLRRASLSAHHQISAEALSVRESMTRILEVLGHDRFVDFVSLLLPAEGRPGVVVAFLAVLELSKGGLLEWAQVDAFGPLQVRRRLGRETEA